MSQRLNLVGATLLFGRALSQLSSPVPTPASSHIPASTSSDSGWGWDDWGDWASTATWWPWDWPDWIPGASDKTSSATEASTASSTLGADFSQTDVVGQTTSTSSGVDEPTTFPTPDVPIPEIPFPTSSGVSSASGSWEASGATSALGDPAFGPESWGSSSIPSVTDTLIGSSTFSESSVPETTEEFTSWRFPWDPPAPSSPDVPDSSGVPDPSFTEAPFPGVPDISSAASATVSSPLLPSFTQAPIPSFPDVSSEEASVSTSDVGLSLSDIWISTITVTVFRSDFPWVPDSSAGPSFTELPEPSFSFPPPPIWSTDEVGTTDWPADVSTDQVASASARGTASAEDASTIPGPGTISGSSPSSSKAPCPFFPPESSWPPAIPTGSFLTVSTKPSGIASDTSSLPLSSLTEVPFFSDVPEASGVPDWPPEDWPPESASDWFPDSPPDFTSSIGAPNWSSKLATILPISDEFPPAESEVPSSSPLSSDFPRVSHDPSFSTAVSRTDFPHVLERRRASDASVPAPRTEASSHSGPNHLARCECGQSYFGMSCSDSLAELCASGVHMCKNGDRHMRPSQAMFRCECDEQTGQQSLKLQAVARYDSARDGSDDYRMWHDGDGGEDGHDYDDERSWDDWEEWAMMWATHG